MIGSSADGRPVRFFFMLCIGWTGMRLFGTIASTAPLPATVPTPAKGSRIGSPTRQERMIPIIRRAETTISVGNKWQPSRASSPFKPIRASYAIAPLLTAWSLTSGASGQRPPLGRPKAMEPLAISVSTISPVGHDRWQGSAWLLGRSGGG